MMHNYNTIIGVIGLRNNKVSYPTIRQRYGIGNSGIDLIMNRYKESGLSWEISSNWSPHRRRNLSILQRISGRITFRCLILNSTMKG